MSPGKPSICYALHLFQIYLPKSPAGGTSYRYYGMPQLQKDTVLLKKEKVAALYTLRRENPSNG